MRSASTAERMQIAMREADMQPADLAKAAKLNKSSVSRYLSGEYEPKQIAVNKMAVALNVSEMWLWGYDVPKERDIEEKEKPTVEDDGLSDGLKELIDHLKTLPEDKIQMLLQVAKSIK